MKRLYWNSDNVVKFESPKKILSEKESIKQQIIDLARQIERLYDRLEELEA